MKNYTQADIDNCRYDHRHLIGRHFDGNRKAVIVKTEGCANLGVQFWNAEDRRKKVLPNTDGTKSRFIEILDNQ